MSGRIDGILRSSVALGRQQGRFANSTRDSRQASRSRDIGKTSFDQKFQQSRSANSQKLETLKDSLGQLQVVDGAISLGKTLLKEARNFVDTALVAGADRKGLTGEVNDIIKQVGDVLQDVALAGQHPFSGTGPEVAINTGMGPTGSFKVKLTGNLKEVSGLSGKKSGSPAEQWTRLFHESYPAQVGYDHYRALAATPDGGVVATGRADLRNGERYQEDILAKYNPDGTVAWQKSYGGSGYDFAEDVTVRSDGWVFQVGSTSSANFQTVTNASGGPDGSGLDAFITRTSPDGIGFGTRLIGGSGDEFGEGVTVGPDGSIYVVGSTSSVSLDGQSSNGSVDVFVTKFDSSFQKQWTRLLGGAGYDVGYSVTSDSTGNIYVVGRTDSTSFEGQAVQGSSDAFITKMRSDGTKEWTKVVGSSGEETAYATTTGSDGSIYIGGRTTSQNLDGGVSGGGMDAFITRFTATGTKEWTKTLGGTDVDYIRGLSASSDGGVYFTGNTQSWTQDNYGTVIDPSVAGGSTSSVKGTFEGMTKQGHSDSFIGSLSAAGSKEWVKLVGGTSSDWADGITTGTDGSLYIAGYSLSESINGQKTGGDGDGFISKFSFTPASVSLADNGKKKFDGLSVDLSSPDNIAKAAAAIDASIEWFNSVSQRVSRGAARGEKLKKYMTQVADVYEKASPSAAEISKVDRGVGVNLMKKDRDRAEKRSGKIGNVTGNIQRAADALSASSNLLESARSLVQTATNEGANRESLTGEVNTILDRAARMMRDSGLFNSSDPRIKVPTGMGTAGSFDISLSGSLKEVGVSSSVDSNPAKKVWTRLVGASGNDHARSVAAGSDGSVYTVGFSDSDTLDSQTSNGSLNAFITKFNPDGTKAWTKLVAGGGYDLAESVAVGTDGNVYVVGRSGSGTLDGQTINGLSDGFIAKFRPDGTKESTQVIGGSGDEFGEGVTVGPDGSIYVVGSTSSVSLDGQSSNGSVDVFVTKFDSSFQKQWTRLLGGAGYDASYSVTSDSTGNIYVVGRTDSTSFEGQAVQGSSDAFITKMRSDGTKEWTKVVGSSGEETAYATTTGSDGSIYIGGRTTSQNLDGRVSGGGMDAFITRFTATGTKEWTKTLGGTDVDYIRGLSASSDGGVYFTGNTQNSEKGGGGELRGTRNIEGPAMAYQPNTLIRSGQADAFVGKLSSLGSRQWVQLSGGTGGDWADGIATGQDGSLYLAGVSRSAVLDGQTNSGDGDAFISKLTLSSVPVSSTVSVLTEKTGSFNGLAVDLTSPSNIAKAASAIDSIADYLKSAEQRTLRGKARAEKVNNYLTATSAVYGKLLSLNTTKNK